MMPAVRASEFACRETEGKTGDYLGDREVGVLEAEIGVIGV